ncbi:uncharacterized protein LOC130657592 [Hydractinia symbiolongicarpus]|uniref:uncharacterized protein LOC130657592 n=1 Tax=Hydractinia symbiolongicarpus TaxID=13093 RepID=UPI002550B9E2|nr:uncharacterized protein LOC130657592 [Hydractinia symbiolongicarpus]
MHIEAAFVVSISLSILFLTIFGWLVACKSWRERDGILLYDAFIIDSLFMLCTILLFTGTKGEKIFTNMYVFLSLISGANRSLIAINRYIVITYPLHYETILSRLNLKRLVILLWVSTSNFAVLSCLFSNSWLPPSRDLHLMFFAPWLKTGVLVAVVVMHGIFVIFITVMEFLSWRTDMGFQNKVCSIIIGRMRTLFWNPYQSFDVHVQDEHETRDRKCIGTTSMILLLLRIIIIATFLGTLSHFLITGTDVFREAHFKVICPLSNILMTLKPLITIFENVKSEDSKALKHSLIQVCCRKNQQVDASLRLTQVTSEFPDPSLLGFSPEFGRMTSEHREEILQLRRDCLEFRRKKQLRSFKHLECPLSMETVL